NGMISTGASAAKGTVVVGLALKPGQLPAGGLHPGDRVAVYSVAVQGQTGIQAGARPAPPALVYDVAAPGQNHVQSDPLQVSVTVPTDEAPLVTQAASAGAVAVAILAPGEQASGKRPRASAPQTAVPPTPQQSTTEQQPTGRGPTPERTSRRPTAGTSHGG